MAERGGPPAARVLAERPDLPPPRPMTEAWQRQRLFQALARAVLGGEPARALLLVVDDLQWCDTETLDWLHYLLRFDPRARLLVIGSCRPGGTGQDCAFAATLPALHRDVRLTEIELGPLDEAQTATLAANVAGQALGPGTAEPPVPRDGGQSPVCGRDPAGRAAGGGGSRTREETSAAAGAGRAGDAPGPALARRPATWPGWRPTVGRSFAVRVLEQAGDGDEDALVQGLDELWQRRIVRERGADAYDFAHDKLREAAYNTLSPAAPPAAAPPRGPGPGGGLRVGAGPRQPPGGSPLRPGRPAASRRSRSTCRPGRRPAGSMPTTRRQPRFRRGLALLEQGAWDAAQQDWLGRWQPGSTKGWATVLRLTGRHEEARAAFETALESVQADDRLHQSQLLVKIGFTWWGQGQLDRALHSYARAEGILDIEPAEPEPTWWQQWLN